MSDDNEILAEIDWTDVDAEIEDADGGRKGLPSASEAHRIHGCPGFLNLKRQLKQRPKSSTYAKSGQRVHSVLATNFRDLDPPLTDEEEKVIDWCSQQWLLLSDKHGPNIAEHCEIVVEQRFFYGNRFTGQVDRAHVGKDVALGADYKCGRIAVEPVESNRQIRWYAVLLAEKFPWRKAYYFAIIQPLVSKIPLIVGYSGEDVKKAENEILVDLKRSEDPDAKRIPGPWCRYCPCQQDCPEARFAGISVAEVKPHALTTPQQIAAFLERVPLAEQVIEAVKEEAKRRLAAGEEIPGYALHPGRVIQEIVNAEVVFGRASKTGVTTSGFMDTVKIGKGKLKDVLKAATGLKGKALDEVLEHVIDGCVKEKIAAAYLVKKEDA